jgi:alkylated DNA repair dioxygenase AlkB
MNFSNGRIIAQEDGKITMYEDCLGDDEARSLMTTLLASMNWQQHWVTVFGKSHPQPRLTAFCAAEPLAYRYSGLLLRASPWPSYLSALVEELNGALGTQWNSCLLNRYRDGRDAMGWHADDEPELGPDPDVGILSLGATRRFALHHKPSGLRTRLLLPSGSLLLMRAPCQRFWRHALPRMVSSGPRISLTFRPMMAPGSHTT